jgi:ribosome-associated heat shock protein Hsp15
LNPSGEAVSGTGRRLDQWLWFARLAKTRSQAARLCACGAVTLNGAPARKPNQTTRIGDTVSLPQGGYRRSVRVMALGSRRGPASEARLLYRESAAPVRVRELMPAWEPLLAAEDDGED